MSLTDGLIAHWKMEEASGTRVDSSAGDNDLIEVDDYTGDPAPGTVGSTTGKLGNCAVFTDDLTHPYVLYGSNFFSEVVKDATETVWVKIIGSWENGQAVDVFTVPFVCQVHRGFDGKYYIYAASNHEVQPGEWIQIFMWDGEALDSSYLSINNGAPINLGTPAGGLGVPGPYADFVIGTSGYRNNVDTLNIDSFSVWNRVLTADERTALYNGGAGLDYPFDPNIGRRIPFLIAFR